MSADPDFAITAANGIDDIAIQTGICDAADVAVFQPVEASRERREPGAPLGVHVDRTVVF